MSNKIVVVDYGVGNLFSVQRALEHCRADAEVTSDPQKVRNAGKVLLPGVGAFADGMQLLSEHGMSEAVVDYASSGNPLFGICLGMQFLFDSSDEHEFTSGLGLVPGKVVAIPDKASDGSSIKVPHIGWNELQVPDGRQDWSDSLLALIEPWTPVYFVHSYMAEPDDAGDRLADCCYGETAISAVISHENVHGAQFHPEKSGPAGLCVLQQFVSLR